MSQRETVGLEVETTIGTGDPLDSIMLIPLLSQWHIPKCCLWNLTGEECKETQSRIYILRKPIKGFNRVGICEKHHQHFHKQYESKLATQKTLTERKSEREE